MAQGKGFMCPQCGKYTLQFDEAKYVCQNCSVIVVEAGSSFSPGQGKGLKCPICKGATLFPVGEQITSNVTTTVFKCNNPTCTVVALIPTMDIEIA